MKIIELPDETVAYRIIKTLKVRPDEGEPIPKHISKYKTLIDVLFRKGYRRLVAIHYRDNEVLNDSAIGLNTILKSAIESNIKMVLDGKIDTMKIIGEAGGGA